MRNIMTRIKFEFYTIRDLLSTTKTIFKRTWSVTAVHELWFKEGEYSTLTGEIKRGTYYSYTRDFWFGKDEIEGN